MANTDLVFRIFGIDVSGGTALDRLRMRAVETGGALETMAKVGAMAFLALGVGAATVVVKSIEMAAQFQRSMELLHTQAGVGQGQIAGLSNQVLDLAGKVGFSPNSLANSLYYVESNFASLGSKAPNAMQVVEAASKGAKIGMADLQDTTTALTATMAAYNGSNLTASQAMAMLNATVGTGEMKWQDLNQAIKTGVMATMPTYGVQLNEIGAALAVFGDNNLRGAQAGTALRMSVQALAKPIQGGAAELTHLGLTMTSLRDEMSQHGLTGALDLFRSKLIANHVPMEQWGAIFTTVFGKRAGIGLLELLKEFDRYNSKIPAINKATKSFGDAWEQTKKTVAVQWDQLKAKWDVFLIKLGNAILPWVNNTLLPALNSIVDWFTVHLPQIEGAWNKTTGVIAAAWHKVDDAFNTVKTNIQNNSTIFTVVAAAIGAVTVAVGLYKTAVMIATIATWAWDAAMAALDALMYANPIGLIILAIIALGAALVALYFKSETFRHAVDTLWSGLVTGAHMVWNAMVAFGQGIAVVWSAVTSAISNAYHAIVSFGEGIRTGLLAVVSAIGAGLAWLGQAFTTLYGGIVSFGEGVKAVLMGIVGFIEGAVVSAFRMFMQVVISVVGNIIHGLDMVTSHIPGMTDPLAGVQAAFDSWAANITAAINNIPTTHSITIDVGLAGAGVPYLSASQNQGITINRGNGLQGFAGGGRPPVGMPSVIGEYGPEIFIPDTPGRIMPNGMGMAELGGNGDTHYHYEVTVSNAVVGNERELTRTIVTALKRARNSGFNPANLSPAF